MAYGISTYKVNYWKIYKSKFELEIDKYQEGCIQRPKGDKFIYAIHANYIEGVLTDISFREGPYGEEMNIRIEDVAAQEVNIITLKANNYLAIGFLKMFPNIKIGFDLTIQIQKSNDFDTLFLRQYNNPVRYYYTQANPNGLPPTKKITVPDGEGKTKEVTDYSDQLAFFRKLVNSRFGKTENPQTPIATSENQTVSTTEIAPEFALEPAPKGEGDLPF